MSTFSGLFKSYGIAAEIICVSSVFYPIATVRQPIVPEVLIASFYGNRRAAICYSFDDGLQNQVDIAVPMLDKYGFKATFFIIPEKIRKADGTDADGKAAGDDNMTWQEVRAMAANGHEIASHSWSHTKNLTTVDDQQLKTEIEKADSLIRKETGSFPQTFAYPWNGFDKRVHAAVYKNHLAAREAQYGIGARFTVAEGNGWVDDLIKKGKWGITMMHGLTKNYDPPSSPDLLDEHFRYVKSLDNQIWVTTFANIIKYTTERDSTKIQVKPNKDGLVCTLTSGLEPSRYDQPLTLCLNLDRSYQRVVAMQHGKKLQIIRSGALLEIDVLPDGSPVVFHWEKR